MGLIMASIADRNEKEKSLSLRGVALAATMVVIMVGIIPVVTIVMEFIMRLLLLLGVFITPRKRQAIRQDVIDEPALDSFTFDFTFSDRLLGPRQGFSKDLRSRVVANWLHSRSNQAFRGCSFNPPIT
ncbi:hypothetical protein BDV97DRAFT_371828 [Delphinella strobiligena]|nr:hypothetical protein BDV97DRAFT_371828 [Delphinella strobiligena]